jgi:hypothetical protein
MYGEWLRVTPDELAQASADLTAAYRVAMEMDERDADITDRRRFGSDKTWHALEYLLGRRDFPVDIIIGEHGFDDSAADWGYGPPMYLTPAEVRAAADGLAALAPADLLDGVDATDLVVNDIYPSVWDRPGELDWAVCHVPHITAYFGAAAKAGDAMICWIS